MCSMCRHWRNEDLKFLGRLCVSGSGCASKGRGLRRRWLWSILVVLGVPGCATEIGTMAVQGAPDFARFAHTSATQYVTLYWDCTRTESGWLRLEGVGVNLWEPVPPRFLELNLFGVDAQGQVLSRTQGVAQGVELLKNFPAPFRLELTEQGGEVRVDLVYRYQYTDDSFGELSRRMPFYVTGRVGDACGKGGRQPR
jgi:hypothetical protein